MSASVDWKLKEELSGTGHVFRSTGRHFGSMDYRLKVFETLHRSRKGLLVDIKRVEGRVARADVPELVGKSFILHLSDGRVFDFTITSADGTVEDHGGHGLHLPADR